MIWQRIGCWISISLSLLLLGFSLSRQYSDRVAWRASTDAGVSQTASVSCPNAGGVSENRDSVSSIFQLVATTDVSRPTVPEQAVRSIRGGAASQ